MYQTLFSKIQTNLRGSLEDFIHNRYSYKLLSEYYMAILFLNAILYY